MSWDTRQGSRKPSPVFNGGANYKTGDGPLSYDFNTPWERTQGSLSIEWKMHNLFSAFDKSAQDVDFDNDEDGKGAWHFVLKAITRGRNKYIQPIFKK